MSVFPYFSSYLQIVQHKSQVTADYITRVFTFSSTVSSIVVSLFIKYTAHYKYYVTFGAAIYLMGMGLMLAYRTEDANRHRHWRRLSQRPSPTRCSSIRFPPTSRSSHNRLAHPP
jgi:hypothetical protein